jgi:hypothetical protein
MERHSTPSFTIQDFEQAADTLNRIVFALTEQHKSTARKLKIIPDPTLENAAQAVQPSPCLCGGLFIECWEKIHTLFDEYKIPIEPRRS